MNPHVRDQTKRVLATGAGQAARVAINLAILAVQSEPVRRKAVETLRKLCNSTHNPKR